MDRRAWRARDIDERTAWYFPLSARCLAALDEEVRQQRGRSGPITAVQVSEGPRAACVAELRPVREALERGRGFVIVEGVPCEKYSVQECQLLYWLTGQLLGRPVEQNVQGTLLYDVRDTGQDVRYGARFSVTNSESTFHTDNSFGAQVTDYIGLLCLQTAKSGGLNQIVSGFSAYEQLRTRHPDVLEILAQPFHVDRRGGVLPGEAATIPFPIFERHGDELTSRYLRYWIEVGHEKAGQPLSPAQVNALNVLDAVLSEPELRVEFGLKPGDMLFVNNRWIFHNRTGFEDHAEPEQQRHLVRLWLCRR